MTASHKRSRAAAIQIARKDTVTDASDAYTLNTDVSTKKTGTSTKGLTAAKSIQSHASMPGDTLRGLVEIIPLLNTT